MKEEKEKKGETTEEGKVEECVLLHYNHSLISHEGLYSVLISCYGNNIFSIILVAVQCKDFVRGNEFTAISSLQCSDITIMSMSPVACAIRVNVHTNICLL